MDHFKEVSKECKSAANSAKEKTCNTIKNVSNEIWEKGSHNIENANKNTVEMLESAKNSLHDAKETVSKKISLPKDGNSS